MFNIIIKDADASEYFNKCLHCETTYISKSKYPGFCDKCQVKFIMDSLEWEQEWQSQDIVNA